VSQKFFCDKNLLDLDINKKSYSNDDEITQTVEDYLSFYSATDEKYNESDFNKNVEKDSQISGRGIEVGHIFSFGDKYSKPMKASVVNIDGKNSNVYMGSYGIGVSRLVATIIECFNDDNGIIWPISVAPFKVNIINLKNNDEECLKKCIEIHDLLENQGIETIFDNRDESAGRKFSDADLIGVPFQLIVGPRELKNGNVELKNRKTDAKEILSFDSAINKIKNKIFEE
jgi:prolyl-tRNA synthetase